MAKWRMPTKTINDGGWFQITVTKPGHAAVDVTFFRGVPTQLSSFSSADPFGDSTATFTFPQITAFDDPSATDLVTWFGLFSNVDIWWVPAFSIDDYHDYISAHKAWIDPITNQADLYAPYFFYATKAGDSAQGRYDLRIKLWEGYVSSIDISAEESTNSVQFQCQGALFQLDRYLQKPTYPPRPLPVEAIIASVFDNQAKPHLRTKPLIINFPANWTRKIPPRASATNAAYVLDGKAGKNWSGYASRQTGSWERCLTGYIQDQLTTMICGAGSAGNNGNQWTMSLQHQSTVSAGRTPVLSIRNRWRTPDFTMWVGTPGVSGQFSSDGTQMANIVYGDGVSIDGTTWRNAIISNDGTKTDYRPLAWVNDVYPYVNNKVFSSHPFVAEAYLKFGAGFEQDQATDSAEQQLLRDIDPGYTGSMTLKVDPSNFSRWLIRPGMTIKVLGLAGTGTDGINMHISEVQCSPMDGSVALTLDTRYRDLLTIQEARARTRDPLTPTRMLQINRTSVLIEDVSAPWDYHAGSGFITIASRDWWKAKSSKSTFPYVANFKAYPPKKHAHFYVRCNANAKLRKDRWTRVPILTAEKGTIRRIEVICVDANGNILKNPFHVSLWYIKVSQMAMPRDKDGPSPYINNSFTAMDPVTGNPWPPGNYFAPEPSFIVGFGGKVNGVFNRAGFYPGAETSGSPASGVFVDDGTFSFDNTSGTNQNWDPNKTVGQKQSASAVTIYAMFYAEYKQPVYFLGRMWRQEPGSA